MELKRFQGSECIQSLIRLREEMIRGTYIGPINGIILNGEGNHPFTINNGTDIEVMGEFSPDRVPSVWIHVAEGHISVNPEKPHTLKLGKDGRGKPIFLSNLNS